MTNYHLYTEEQSSIDSTPRQWPYDANFNRITDREGELNEALTYIEGTNRLIQSNALLQGKGILDKPVARVLVYNSADRLYQFIKQGALTATIS